MLPEVLSLRSFLLLESAVIAFSVEALCSVFFILWMQELGFSYIELNASDMRSKRNLSEALGSAVSSRTLSDYFGKQ